MGVVLGVWVLVWCVKARKGGKVMSGLAGATFIIQYLALVTLWVAGFVYLIVEQPVADCSQLFHLTLLYMSCL